MSFSYMVGRFYPQSKNIYIKAIFTEIDEAKKYAAERDLDICPNSILFIDDRKEKNTVFLSSLDKRWKPFHKSAYYNCKNDCDEWLGDAMYYQDFCAILEAAMLKT